jgi:hypothetical protein
MIMSTASTAPVQGLHVFEEMDGFVAAYLTCALWSTNDNSDERGGGPLDANFSIFDFSPQSILQAKHECRVFRDKAEAALEVFYEGPYGDDQAGHGFWLDRNRHGAGALDHQGLQGTRDVVGFDGACQALHDLAQSFGEQDVIVCDDGRLWLEGGNEL